MQLVAEQQQGGPSSASPPPPNCSLRQMLRWKHSSSNAVAVVAKAVLQGKVPQLEAAIEQRRARDAQIAEAEKKLTAMMEVFRQEMQGLRNPGSSGQQSDGDGGLEPFSTDGLGNQLATAAKALDLSSEGAAVAAAEEGHGAAPGTATKKRPGPVVTPAAAGAATATGTGTPPVERVKAQGGTGCSCLSGGVDGRGLKPCNISELSVLCVCHMQASLTRLTRPGAASCKGVLGCSFLASAAALHSRPLMQRQRHMRRSWGEAADSVRVFFGYLKGGQTWKHSSMLGRKLVALPPQNIAPLLLLFAAYPTIPRYHLFLYCAAAAEKREMLL